MLSIVPFLLAPFHVVVDVTSHGLGHVAQAACVVNALNKTLERPMRLTLRTTAPIETLNERIVHRPMEVIEYQQDAGMIMHDALRVDIHSTRMWYENFHRDFDSKVAAAAEDFENLQPDLLLSNVPYLGIKAAKLVGIRNVVSLCSLNWAGVYASYCGRDKIHQQMVDAYNQADLFLQPEPSMDMSDLRNLRPIGPLSIQGNRIPLASVIEGCDQDTKFVLVGVGGVGLELPLACWPRLPNVVWIIPTGAYQESILEERPDILPQSVVEEKQVRYIDLLASVHCVVTKTGYGTQVEAVVHCTPTVCIARKDWPEHIPLSRWHQDHGVVEFIDYKELSSPRFGRLVSKMLQQEWNKPRVQPTGARDAADILAKMLQGNASFTTMRKRFQ